MSPRPRVEKKLTVLLIYFHASAVTIAMARLELLCLWGVCPFLCPILNIISQEPLKGISLNLAQTCTWITMT